MKLGMYIMPSEATSTGVLHKYLPSVIPTMRPLNLYCFTDFIIQTYYVFSACRIKYSNCNEIVRFEVLTAVMMKMPDFWDVKPCNLVDVYRLYGELPVCIFRVEMSADYTA
jgi:hypothetical protein